jgi:hypothetical protein
VQALEQNLTLTLFSPTTIGAPPVTEKETKEHLEFVDGIQKAQLVVLRLLLREQPAMKAAIKQYAHQLDLNPPAPDLTPMQLRSMREHLLILGD